MILSHKHGNGERREAAGWGRAIVGKPRASDVHSGMYILMLTNFDGLKKKIYLCRHV